MKNDLLVLEHVSKSYSTGGNDAPLSILEDINLTVAEGEVVAITGKSGCGKSTLLSVSALLLSRDGGNIYYDGVSCDDLGGREGAALRNRKMGFVFQSSMLLEDFSALENAAMPLLIRGMKKKEAFEKAEEYLSLVDMTSRMNHKPSRLSGGERQRTAIARALSAEPSIIFADEPTGSLDEKTSQIIEDLLLSTVRTAGKGLVLVTHNLSFAHKADKVYVLSNGRLNDVK